MFFKHFLQDQVCMHICLFSETHLHCRIRSVKFLSVQHVTGTNQGAIQYIDTVNGVLSGRNINVNGIYD